MTTEEKFNAAVNVIRSLPKNGSYQPSNELMLRFYAYYKQATQGPCSGSRPMFYDLVGRAKYDAWKKLGDMSKNEAMARYVDELHSIVETMSYSDKVANFLEAPTNELDSINFDDLELVAGDVLERVRSQPNSPIGSREGSPIRFISSLSSSRSASPSAHDEDSDHSEEYIDTIEIPEPKKCTPNGQPPQMQEPAHIPNGVVHISRTHRRSHNVDISLEISKAVESLRVDILRLSDKVHTLETASKNAQLTKKRSFFELQPQTLALIVIWPFVVNLIMNRWLLRRK